MGKISLNFAEWLLISGVNYFVCGAILCLLVTLLFYANIPVSYLATDGYFQVAIVNTGLLCKCLLWLLKENMKIQNCLPTLSSQSDTATASSVSTKSTPVEFSTFSMITAVIATWLTVMRLTTWPAPFRALCTPLHFEFGIAVWLLVYGVRKFS